MPVDAKVMATSDQILWILSGGIHCPHGLVRFFFGQGRRNVTLRPSHAAAYAASVCTRYTAIVDTQAHSLRRASSRFAPG